VRREPDPISRRLKLGSRGSEHPNPPHPVEVVGANNSLLDIDHEDREACRSPRGARSVSAFCSERDGDYADRVFAFVNSVLKLAMLKTAPSLGTRLIIPTTGSQSASLIEVKMHRSDERLKFRELKQRSRRRYAANGFALSPIRAVFLDSSRWAVEPGSEVMQQASPSSQPPVPGSGTPQSDGEA